MVHNRWAIQPQLAKPARNGFERRVPLWPKAALPHTPQLRFWFLLFAVVGVVCVGSGAVRQLGPLCNYTFDTVKEVPNHERHSPAVRIFQRVPLALVLPLSPESAPGS